LEMVKAGILRVLGGLLMPFVALSRSEDLPAGFIVRS
jgi:hypothetical protein